MLQSRFRNFIVWTNARQQLFEDKIVIIVDFYLRETAKRRERSPSPEPSHVGLAGGKVQTEMAGRQ